MPKFEREKWITPFIKSLNSLLGDATRLEDKHAPATRRDSASLAKLRRGLTGQSGESLVWVYGHLGGAHPEHEEAALLVASLFAVWHQGTLAAPESLPSSLGASFNALARAERLRSGLSPDDPLPNIERRFAVLLDSHSDELGDRLRQAVSLLKSKEVAIDWESLLRDLIRWNAEKRPVQRRWARDFWARRSTGVDVTTVDAGTEGAEIGSNHRSEETSDDR